MDCDEEDGVIHCLSLNSHLMTSFRAPLLYMCRLFHPYLLPRYGRNYSEKWVELAGEGDHFKLAYNVGGSWELMYNLWWDDLLDLDLFPVVSISKRMGLGL